MNLLKSLWKDESGVVVSAETVLVGTVGVLGAVAGLSQVSHAVDAELKEVSFAIRSLDQSYGYCGHQTCCAWTAGSSFLQPSVEKALADLGTCPDTDPVTIQQQNEAGKKAFESRSKRTPRIEESTPMPLPNDLPEPDASPQHNDQTRKVL